MAETKRGLSLKTFVWHETDMPLRTFMDRYSHHAPFLIMFTTGYLGRDERMHGVSSDEVCWFHDVAKQPRVVVKNHANKYFSIPYDFKHHVQVVKKRGDAETIDATFISITELMSRRGAKYFRFKPMKSGGRINFYKGAGEGEGMLDFGTLEIVSTYDECFILAHTMRSDGLFEDPTIIPVYMPIDVTIALGSSAASMDHFHQLMLDFKTMASGCNNNYMDLIKQDAEIMVFDSEPVDSDYQYICLRKVDSEHQYTSLSTDSKSEKPDVISQQVSRKPDRGTKSVHKSRKKKKVPTATLR